MKEPQFDTLAPSKDAYTRMRVATTEMSRLNLELLAEKVHADARETVCLFDKAVDQFLAANAELERLGFWASKDAMYLPPEMTARSGA
ncbi:MAG: hypothetical protein AAGI09_02745 [Pseudomonadota bacterium]